MNFRDAVKEDWMKPIKIFSVALSTLMIAGCVVGPVYHAPVPEVPSQFRLGIPAHPAVNDAKEISDWWRQFDDPLVAELIETAQSSSPTVAQALARIVQARGTVTSARSALFPEIKGDASSLRSKQAVQPNVSVVGTTNIIGVDDAAWQLDLFGATRKATDAANSRLTARMADWHGVRVSLAAEVANTLLEYRACVEIADILEQDLGSREQTGQLTAMKIRAGFTAPADGALTNASIADARQQLIAQHAACDLDVTALVDLTGIDETTLRTKLAPGKKLPHPLEIVVEQVPAKAVAQRPDITSAERDLAAAGAEINVAVANRYPSISLGGNIGLTNLLSQGASGTAVTWSFGPSLSLPLFDAGNRKAQVDIAQARYDEAYGLYRQKVRSAVREIEEALVKLDSAAHREADAASAARDYDLYFKANVDKFKSGAGSLFELEDARRTSLSAQQILIGVQRDRVAAWIALYKAMGGGWHPNTLVTDNAG